MTVLARLRAQLPRVPRVVTRLRVGVLGEYAGLAAITYGVWQISEPAAWIAGGVLLVVEALAGAVG